MALRRPSFLLASVALLMGAGPCSSNSGQHVIVFAFRGFPQDTLRVAVTDTATVAAATRYVQSGAGARVPNGIIVHGKGVDARYPFHFLRETVQLTQLAMELCDGAPMHSRAEVDRFMSGAGGSGGKARWCPWAAYPIRVE